MAFRLGIVGGGISGLACALKARELMPETEIHVLEASQRFGGLIETCSKDGFTMELGPDCFLNDRPWLEDWIRKIGLESQLIGTSPLKRRSFIYQNGKLNPVPSGFYLISPTSLGALLKNPIISWPGKLRMAWEYFVPRRKDGKDESVSEFILRRFGREALVKIGQPMVGGIYTADPSRLSMRAALPKFYAMERESGSLIKALSAKKSGSAERGASGPRYGLFASFQNGMEELIQSLVSRLSDTQLRTDFAAETVLRLGSSWQVRSSDGQTLEFDAVCLAVPAHKAGYILKHTAPEISSSLEKIPYESAMIVNFAYDLKSLPPLPEGFGVVVPEKENRKIVGLTFCHQKFAGRAPEEKVLIRVFMGGAFHRDLYELSDSEITALAEQELRAILKIQAEPLWTNLRRYPKAMPQYEVGHLERVETIFTETEKYPGLFLTGNAYHGVGIPESIDRADRAAEKIFSFSATVKNTEVPDHILLVGFGGPEKTEDVWPFLKEVTKGTNVPEERLKDVLHHYELVGGKSPYNEAALKLAGEIASENLKKGIDLPVYIGMKNWHPFMKDTLAEIKARGLKKGLALVLAPHRSEASWDKYVRCVNDGLKESSAEDIRYSYLKPWYENSAFIGAQTEEIRKVFNRMSPEEKNGVHVIFCAHSIPLAMAQKSRYVQEFQASSLLTARRLDLTSWEIAYQSRSGSPRQPWLEPDVCSLFDRIKAKGMTGVMIVPIGFWCDNVEVLFDLDIEAKAEALKRNLKFWRVPTSGNNPVFAAMFSDMIAARLKEK